MTRNTVASVPGKIIDKEKKTNNSKEDKRFLSLSLSRISTKTKERHITARIGEEQQNI